MNQNKIYVGNLPYSATEDELRELFSQHGDVTSVSLVNDRETEEHRWTPRLLPDPSPGTRSTSGS